MSDWRKLMKVVCCVMEVILLALTSPFSIEITVVTVTLTPVYSYCSTFVSLAT